MSSSALHGLLAAAHYQELPLNALDATRVEALWRYASPEPCDRRILQAEDSGMAHDVAALTTP